MRRTVAIASCAMLNDGRAPDDLLLSRSLARHAVDASICNWDDPGIDWAAFDAVVPRSTWDYFQRPREFLAWLDRLQAGGVPTINAVDVVRWNADKRYLLDFQQSGIPVVPTEIVPLADVPRAADRWNDREVVVKPTISGTSWHTIRGVPGSAGFRDLLGRLPADLLYMVQPFLPEIQSAGEWSLVFLGGDFSHAVVKTPADGDYRVQNEFGGIARPAKPDADLIEHGKAILDAAAGLGAKDTAYARVDGVVVDDVFLLMELELIEPNLHLGVRDDAADVLAQQIAGRLR